MTEFRVWAPEAGTVQLCIGDSRFAMAPQQGGWWCASAPDAGPDCDYAYRLDDSGPFPDPRSAWQPFGVHGPSRVVDHLAFPWTDRSWQAPPLSSAVIYELHIGTFTPEGTFDAAIQHLEYLRNLGVTHVELMPVNEFPGDRGWGYDGVDLYAPHHSYGGPDGLKRLIDACHAAGLAAILDVVYNHLGPDGNYLARFGPYFTERHCTPWGPALNLDGQGSSEVRRFLCDNARMWLRDYHFDGLRLDAVHAIFDSSAVNLLEQIAREVEELEAHLGRHLVVMAESDLNDPRLVMARDAGGFGLTAQWSDDFHHALHTVLTGEQQGYYGDFGSFDDLAKALQQAFVYDGRYSPFRQRNHGRRAASLPGDRFIGYLQNHDQVGNRARGERSSMLMNPDRLKIGAAVVLCAPFVPLLFQGEEFGAKTPFLYFTDHRDAKLAQAVPQGRIREFSAFGWKPEDIPNPQDPATFQNSKLHFCRQDRSLLDWHRSLIALRRAEPGLTDGRLDRIGLRCSQQRHWLAFRRGAITVAFNLDSEKQSVPLDLPGVVVLSSSSGYSLDAQWINLPPDSVAILKHSGQEH